MTEETNRRHYPVLVRGQYSQWFRQSGDYHSANQDWYWMQEDIQAIQEVLEVKEGEVIIIEAVAGKVASLCYYQVACGSGYERTDSSHMLYERLICRAEESCSELSS